jgi:hypothetical protein
MSRINRVPFGLQDLLGSQNFGDNPSELSGVVAPTLDMGMFLTAERTNYAYKAVAISNNGLVTSFVVPEGEVWYVTGFGFGMKPSSGTPSGPFGLHMGVYMFNLPGSDTPGGVHPIGGVDFDFQTPAALTTESDAYKGYQLPIPMAVFGGSTIRFMAAGMYGDNNWACKANVQYFGAKQ